MSIPSERVALLRRVEHPSRYLGGEVGAVVKPDAELRIALLFPDVYEVAESHLGLKILYSLINAQPGLAAERVYAPWTDLRDAMRKEGLPLGSLETGRPLREFDIVGVSLQYEASYPTLLAMLDLGGVPLAGADRGPADPVVVAGGPCAFNPEPLAAVLDAVALGDGEEVVLDLAAAVNEAPRELDRPALWLALARIPGVYAPGLYEEVRDADGHFTGLQPRRDDAPPLPVEKRVVADLDAAPFPTAPVVPNHRPIHDRVAVEIQRGCTRGCRFCHAGMVYRPTRQRSAERVLALAEQALAASGHEELGLLSLSAGDHPCLNELVAELLARHQADRTAVSLPSLRVETLKPELAAEIRKVRKTGFTIAPEAGTERLRRVLNKGYTEAELLETVRSVAAAGWRVLKLYFMIGLPTETDEDVEGIAELVQRCRAAARRAGRVELHISLSALVPKSHTPFQWEPMEAPEQLTEKFRRLARRLRGRGVRVRWQDPELSLVEAALARGDRRVGAALLAAFQAGQYLDSWSEHFSLEAWQQAFAAADLDLDALARSPRDPDGPLPWDHLSARVDTDYLRAERERALAAELTPDCREGECLDCGACDVAPVEPRVAPAYQRQTSPRPPRPEPPPARVRVRLTLTAAPPAALLSHLELRQSLVRALRRAGWPLAYSQGFHPQAKTVFEWARPVGLVSRGERVDVELRHGEDPRRLQALLAPQLPDGLTLERVEPLPAGAPSAAAALAAIDYEFDLAPYHDAAAVAARLERFAAAEELWITRRRPGKPERRLDLKACLADVRHQGASRVTLRVVVGPEGTPNPREILEALFAVTGEAALDLFPVKTGSVLRAPGAADPPTRNAPPRGGRAWRTGS